MFKKISVLAKVLKTAAKLLMANDPLRMGAATAFFCTFALPPVLMIIVRTFGLFFNRRTLGREVLGKISSVIGHEGGQQILGVIEAIHSYQFRPFAKFLIFVFLLFVATTLFMIVKNSVNQLWSIRTTAKRHFASMLKSRLKATGIILFTGVLFLSVMAVDIMLAYLGPYLREVSPQVNWLLYQLINHAMSLLVVTIWFFAIFRFLPDGRPRNSVAFSGALLTGLLFSVGKYVLQWMLSGRIQLLYGNSGALVLILLFVFYASLILYYGAAFTKTWAQHLDKDIVPLPHAGIYHLTDDATKNTVVAGSAR